MENNKYQEFLENFKQLYTTGKRTEAVELIRDFFKAYEGGDNEMDNCLIEVKKLSEQWKKEKTAEAYYINAYAKSWGKEYEDIINNLQKSIEIQSDYFYAYNLLGYIYYNLKEYDKVIINYVKAIELKPDYAYAYNNLGNAYKNLKEYDKAKFYYDKVIKLKPDYADVYNNLGNLYADLKEYDKAQFNYEKAIELKSDFAFAYSNLGRNYEALKEYDKAIFYYEKAIELKPDYPDFYNSLGYIFNTLNDYEKGKLKLEKAIKLNPEHAYAYNNLGNSYFHFVEYDKAISNYEKAIKLKPDYEHPYYNLGNLYRISKEYEKAKINYEKAIKLKPDYAYAHYGKALTNEVLANKKKEVKLYEEAIIDYEMYIKFSNESNNKFLEYAKENIEELKKKLANKDYDDIASIVEKIKAILYFDKQCISHYTTFSAAKFLLLEGSKLRLSEGSFLNDTSEGKQLFKYLNWHTSITTKNDVEEIFTEKPFVGSFVAEHEHNNLALWRMYGKDGQDEAKGCAITINKDKFIEALKAELKLDKDGSSNMSDDIFTFYNVAYKNADDGFILPFKPSNHNKFNGLMNKLKEKIASVGLDKGKIVSEGLSKEKLRNDVTILLNDIAYLFKTAEYQYEHEVRLVIKGIGFNKEFNEVANPPKVYIDLTNILPAVSKLTLGPKVDKPDEWAATFNYKFKQQDFKDIEVVISRLPYK